MNAFLTLHVPMNADTARLNRRLDALKARGWQGPNATLGPQGCFNFLFIKRVPQ